MKTPKQMLIEMTEKGHSQMDIQRGTGISQATISRILSGAHPNPMFESVVAIHAMHKKVMRKSA